MVKTIQTIVVGTRYPNEDGSSRSEYIEKYVEDEKSLILTRDRLNQHDPNAIQVLVDTGGTSFGIIGFIPRKVAATLAPLMGAGKQVDAWVEFYEPGDEDELPEIEIEIRVYDDVKSMLKGRQERTQGHLTINNQEKSEFSKQLKVVLIAVIIFAIMVLIGRK